MRSASPNGGPKSGQGLRSAARRWTVRGYLRAIWARREFAAHMPMEELRAQHMNTALGNLWHLLNPLLLTGVYYLVFGVLLDVTRGGLDNFVAFLTIGVFTFHYTQKSVLSGAKSIISNEGLIRSLIFPRAILPLGSVIAQTIALGPAVCIMLFVAIGTGERPLFQWMVLVPLFACQAVFNFGVSMVFARMMYRLRDVEQILPYVFRLAFYGSGVLYPVSVFVSEGPWRLLFNLNPLFGFVTTARWAVMSGEAGREINAIVVVSIITWSVLVLVFGFLFFIRGEREFGRE